MKTLLINDSEGGGGGQDQSFERYIPEEFKSEPSLRQVKTIPDLIKSYVHAQRMVGAEKIPAPQKGWGEKEWGEFYGRIGRPETPDKYGDPDVRPHESLKLDGEKIKGAREVFHKLGLTDAQARGVLGHYFKIMNDVVAASETDVTAAKAASEAKAREMFGDKMPVKLDIARATLKKFGGDELVAYLDETGLGNDLRLVKAFVDIGEALSEDDSRGGTASRLSLSESTRAMQEIERLKLDKEFLTALTTGTHAGHASALQRWTELHQAAYPERPEDR